MAAFGWKGGFSAEKAAFRREGGLTISYNFSAARVPGIKNGLWQCTALFSSRFYFQQEQSIFSTVLDVT